MHLRTLSSVVAAATFVLLAPDAARASQCAEDLALLEPTNVEITVTPEVDCLTIEAISAGCGDQVAIRLENDCEVSAFVSGDVGECTEAPCEVPAEGRFFVYLDQTEGHVDVTFAVTIGGTEREVTASFDIEEPIEEEPIHDHDHGGVGCSATGAPGANGWAPVAALLGVAALGLRSRSRAQRS
ncbi:MAG: hypothetical protein IPM79_38545 [Polyangiaceae bacterium]|nr:hypothetical protein [Polyangiaceae bacterium]